MHGEAGSRVVGVTVSHPDATQRPKVEGMLQRTGELLGVDVPTGMQIELWGPVFRPALWRAKCRHPGRNPPACEQEGLLLDPVYKARPRCLLDGIVRGAFPGRGPSLFCIPAVPRRYSPIINEALRAHTGYSTNRGLEISSGLKE